MPLVYKLTFPNGKIYVGSDLTDSAWYFGSPSKRVIEVDYPITQDSELTITKKILWFDPNADKSSTLSKEIELILALKANDPSIGYNLSPKWPNPTLQSDCEEPGRSPAKRVL